MKRAAAAAVGVAVLLAGLAAAVLVVRGGSGSSRPEPYRGSAPPGRIVLPTFALPRYDGSGVVRSSALRGRVVLTTFVDSACTQSCPIIVGILGRALRQLAVPERRDLAALAISVDPKADTPRHVRRFLAQRGALGRLDYLVAPVRHMRPVWKGFHLLTAAQTGNPSFHSADVRIFGRDGVWVSTMHAGVDLDVANVLHDIRRAMAER